MEPVNQGVPLGWRKLSCGCRHREYRLQVVWSTTINHLQEPFNKGAIYRLPREELPGYLSHRLSAAGCELPLFDRGATEALFQTSQALPRKVNRLAHYALTAAAIEKEHAVTAEHVQSALQEIGL